MYKLSGTSMIFSKKQIIIFMIFMILLIFISYFYIDKNISFYFIQHAEIYKYFGKTASIIGESQWYIGVAILGSVYAYFKKNLLYLHRFLFLLYVNLFSGLVSLVFKMLSGRLRPWKLENGGDGYGFLINQNSDFTFLQNIHYQFSILLHDSTPNTSFPSGHTTTMFAMFTYMSILFPKYIYLWLSIAVFTAVSRILANDHFFSDIVGGIIVGTLCTMFIYSKIKDKINA